MPCQQEQNPNRDDMFHIRLQKDKKKPVDVDRAQVTGNSVTCPNKAAALQHANARAAKELNKRVFPTVDDFAQFLLEFPPEQFIRAIVVDGLAVHTVYVKQGQRRRTSKKLTEEDLAVLKEKRAAVTQAVKKLSETVGEIPSDTVRRIACDYPGVADSYLKAVAQAGNNLHFKITVTRGKRLRSPSLPSSTDSPSSTSSTDTKAKRQKKSGESKESNKDSQ